MPTKSILAFFETLYAIMNKLEVFSGIVFPDWLSSRTFGRQPLLTASLILPRIGDGGAADFGEGSERMNVAASRTHYVLGADSMNQQGIRDQ